MEQSIKITKMQGCGNDFVIVDYNEYKKSGLSMDKLAIKLCDRHFGVGADGMIIPNLNSETADIGWYFYNSDGTTAQMCGNGIRCFAKYVFEKGFVNTKKFPVETLRGIITPEILDDGNVRVDMGAPILEESKIPFSGKTFIQIRDREFKINPVSMGNPHCVIFVNENTMDMAKNYVRESTDI